MFIVVVSGLKSLPMEFKRLGSFALSQTSKIERCHVKASQEVVQRGLCFMLSTTSLELVEMVLVVAGKSRGVSSNMFKLPSIVGGCR